MDSRTCGLACLTGALLLLAPGCDLFLPGSGGQGETCLDGRCEPGLVCTDGHCHKSTDGGQDGDNGPECETSSDCNDENPCTSDLCAVEECHNAHFPDTTPCSDGDSCTVDDQCVQGVCEGTPRDCSGLDGVCLRGVCDPELGECTTEPVSDGTDCDDGLYCTDGDSCRQGACTGDPLDCNDDDICTVDSCSEAENHCNHTLQPIPGAEGPQGHETCSNLVDDDCDGYTDQEDSNCTPCSQDWECEDENPCTEDQCLLEICRNEPLSDGTSCDDGLYCTDFTQCNSGLCTGESRDCSNAGDMCHEGVCNETLSECVRQVKPDGTSCDVGNYCSLGGQCIEGACAPVEDRDCNDDDPCTVDNCNDLLDQCEHVLQPNPGMEGPPGDSSCDNLLDDDCDGLTDEEDANCIPCSEPSDCDDENSCTDDDCVGNDCQNTPVNDGQPCGDGLYCTDPDTCQSGVCNGQVRDCDDADPCTLDDCDESIDQCTNDLEPQPDEPEICFDEVDQNCDGIPDGCCLGTAGLATSTCLEVDDLCQGVWLKDLNGDAILDVVVGVVQTVDEISVFLGNGSGGQWDGTFSPKVDYTAGTDPNHVVLGDFNADGITDLAAANWSSNNVSVLLGAGADGIGDGTFGVATDYPVSASPSRLTTADLNGDGILDLAVVAPASNHLNVLLGNGSDGRGDGTFQEKVDYETAARPQSLAVADFNEDGALDLVTVNREANNLSVFLGQWESGQPTGTFPPCQDVAMDPAVLKPYSVITGDFNADGILDLVTANRDSNDVSLLPGQGAMGVGNGTFDASVQFGLGAYTDPTWAVASDMNADGIEDLVVVTSSESVLVLLGGGSDGHPNGTFGLPTAFDASFHTGYTAATGDLNKDGIDDVVQTGDGCVSVMLGTGSGVQALGTFEHVAAQNMGRTAGGFVVRDFNGDSIPDLALTRWGQPPTENGLAVVFQGDGSGGRGNGTFFQGPNIDVDVGQMPGDVVSGLFNQDGILDLAVANAGSEDISILFGQGNGEVFSAGDSLIPGGSPIAMATGDYSGDAVLDLVVAVNQPEADAVVVFIGGGAAGQGDGTFLAPVTYELGDVNSEVSDMVSGDFNADAIQDLAIIDYGGDLLFIFTGLGTDGRGNGEFAVPPASRPVGSSPAAVATGDFDSDEILDLAVANHIGNTVDILLGNGSEGRGDGTFGNPAEYQAGTGPRDIATGDFNKDGILDLAVIAHSASKLSVLLGNGTDGRGDGTFHERVEYPLSGTPRHLRVVDWNADGVLDIVILDDTNNDIIVLGGLGECLASP